MLEFYKTIGGKRFIDYTIPKLADSLKRIADIMEKEDQLKDKTFLCETCGTKYNIRIIEFGSDVDKNIINICPGCERYHGN